MRKTTPFAHGVGQGDEQWGSGQGLSEKNEGKVPIPAVFFAYLYMQKKKGKKICNVGWMAALVAFLTAFLFFLTAYPYHLMRREQLTLFLFDGDYIRQTYRGTGWLAAFTADFLEQFFRLPVAGPLVVALLLTAIGAVVYRICRRFMGRWPSLAVAAVFYLWSFMRETDNTYITRYTIVVLGYLSLVLLALQFRKAWLRPVAAALLLACGAWALGLPFHQYYGRAWGVPRLDYERMVGLDTEVSRENWDKVLKLSEKDLYMVEASYCYNLAHAMKGDLGDALFNHSQSNPYNLLLHVSTERAAFSNCLAGEAWFQLGDMTVAEQSSIIALQGSPKHTGSRFLVRLARVNLASGETAAAEKYLDLLSKTLFYGGWARGILSGTTDETTSEWLAKARKRLITKDFIHHSNDPRSILLALLEADPSNAQARQYLLCFDLMRMDLDGFIEEYMPEKAEGHVYQEGVLVWLSQRDALSEENAAVYGVGPDVVKKMDRFFRYPDLYKDTFWYYCLKMMDE